LPYLIDVRLQRRILGALFLDLSPDLFLLSREPKPCYSENYRHGQGTKKLQLFP
jgi:hypothetical protein